MYRKILHYHGPHLSLQNINSINQKHFYPCIFFACHGSEQEGKSRVVVEASEDNKNEGITSMFDALAQDATVNGMDSFGAILILLTLTRT